MDTLKSLIQSPSTGLLSTFGGIGLSLTGIEIWLRILSLTVGLTIGILNLICRFSNKKFWFCTD
jgi:hypothetical protein